MSVDSMAILILLGSFCILSDVSGTSSDYYLPADGKRNQFLQLNGSTFLYHHGMPYGFRWYF